MTTRYFKVWFWIGGWRRWTADKGEMGSPVCRACKKAVPAKTTNVISHQQEHHPDLHSEVSPAQGKVIQLSSLLYWRSLIKSANTNRVLPVLVSWIVQSATFLPAVLHCTYVDKPGFRKLVLKIDPQYTIPHLYNEIRDGAVKPVLEGVKCFSATTDLWTSIASHPYLSLTTQFFVNEEDGKRRPLQAIYG